MIESPTEIESTIETQASTAEARSAVAEKDLWYHSIEVGSGVVTPGWFDLRSIVELMPWPDVEGKRCLDVGTYDGYLAFELERRGASEVVATDIGDPWQWDWPARSRVKGPDVLRWMAGEVTGDGFRIAHRLLGSRVERQEISIYDLSPERLGEFDVVVCGSLMLHLRDPIRAMEAIRSVCSGYFLSAETIHAGLSVMRRRTPAARLRGGDDGQWWIPNVAGHRKMVSAAGFEIERTTKPYSVALGVGHPAYGKAFDNVRQRALAVALTRRSGVPHAALLARPADFGV